VPSLQLGNNPLPTNPNNRLNHQRVTLAPPGNRLSITAMLR